MRMLAPLVLLLLAGLTGCADTQPAAAALTATLVSPTDIRLDWRAAPPGALGNVVEYSNQPTGKFTVLAFLPATATSYTHPRLIPNTAFYYRVRAFFGQETPPVVATVDDAGPAPTEGNWAAPRTAPRPQTDRHSLRYTASHSGPSDLRAEPVGADGIRLSWTDHADDEEGYLVEVTPANTTTTRVAAMLAPRINEIGVYPLPAERSAAYRVVAFYYGPPTPTIHQTTN